ncbi:MAG: hypothetical protein HXX08_11290 [Chloroflexi bacterium]|uniref:Uncharacterized protein n=1 Tax=Candidatus Chlorohelix allophototropha TaxID=3003348 RepID=A0A8T7LZD0_9CHLR|nr:hypothetical protein [Chloroflexota bacterium]WJW65821.1 hypothetical protein OZ401_001600 [Chloroflexota bacterium L227-S17]
MTATTNITMRNKHIVGRDRSRDCVRDNHNNKYLSSKYILETFKISRTYLSIQISANNLTPYYVDREAKQLVKGSKQGKTSFFLESQVLDWFEKREFYTLKKD